MGLDALRPQRAFDHGGLGDIQEAHRFCELRGLCLQAVLRLAGPFDGAGVLLFQFSDFAV